jgi:hypothetical protein
MMWRRKRLPDELRAAFEAFREVVGHVESAKSILTGSVPSTRFAGRPLAETLAGFEEELGRARAGMPRWRRPEVEDGWRSADGALSEALALAARIRLEAASPKGFEDMIWLIGALLAPLDAFGQATAAFSGLHVRVTG